VGFGGRALGDDHPKYLNSPETEIFAKRDLLYGFPQVSEAIRRERSALVVEGYTDVLMLYQAGIKNAVATLGTATTPGHLKILGNQADMVYVLFDPDAAGSRAAERIVRDDLIVQVAAELQTDLRLLQLSADPADWLREHSAEEFLSLLDGAVPVLEFAIRNIVEKHRGTDAMSRSRAVPEIKKLVGRIDDSVLRREALRLASEALDVDLAVFRDEPHTSSAGARRTAASAPSDPLQQAGHDLLALMLSRPDLVEGLLRSGVEEPFLPEPLTLRAEDFGDEEQYRIFALLQEHAGRDLDALIADERVRPLMDRISALASAGEKLYPSEAAIREAWLRVGILSRERAKRQTSDYDEKERIQTEVSLLKDALRAVASKS
jgi:DNA primase